MHLLTTSSTSLDEIVEAVDLGQTPGDIVVLSFADSDLAALASAWETDRATLPSIRLAHLRDLRHPMSVDLWIDRVAPMPRSSSFACWAGSSGGSTASSGFPRWRVPAALRLRSCPAKTATIPGSPRRRLCRSSDLDVLLRVFPRRRPRQSARIIAGACAPRR